MTQRGHRRACPSRYASGRRKLMRSVPTMMWLVTPPSSGAFLESASERGPPGTLSGSGEILHDHFPDVVTIAVEHHSSAAKRRIRTSQGVLGRTNRKTIHRLSIGSG